MKSNSRLTFLFACLAAVAVRAQQSPAPQPPPAPPQQQPPTFRVEVNYVEVDATVTDASGKPVSDLTENDFEVLEEGKPQKIATFSVVNIPVERVEPPIIGGAPVEPDVQSNARANGRVYLIVLDDLHINALRSARVKVAARRLIERHFGANDLAAIVYTGGRSDAGQEFTNNRRLLLASIDRFMGRKLRSPTQERLEAYQRGVGTREGDPASRVADPNLTEREFNARNTLDSLKKLADFMADVHGRRKALVLFSEGIDYDIHDVFSNSGATTVIDSTRDAIAAATRANVNIYAIDPRGLTSMGDEGIEISGPFPDDPAYGISRTALTDELRLAQDSLRTLSEETGGFAAVSSNDFDGAYNRLVRENSTYYMLGYYPANERRDGRFRKIEVRVKRPGVQVRSRKGYVAPRGKPPAKTDAPNATASMRDAMNSPLPIAAIPMTVFAAPYKGTAPNASVAIALELGVGQFTYAEKNGMFANDLELGFVAVDNKGQIHRGDRNTINLSLKPDTLARVKERGFRVTSQIDLPPGRYQLRVAAAESGGKAGTVLYDLEVPDFYKAPLTMSGIAMTAASAGQTPTARSKDPLRDFLPGPPTASREFDRRDEIALFGEIYENAPDSAAHKLDITTTVRSEDGRVVLQNQEERSSTELKGGRGGYGFTTRIPLGSFAPGSYVIHIEAKSRTAPDKGVGRDVQILVK